MFTDAVLSQKKTHDGQRRRGREPIREVGMESQTTKWHAEAAMATSIPKDVNGGCKMATRSCPGLTRCATQLLLAIKRI
jgi:hypothetical protein